MGLRRPLEVGPGRTPPLKRSLVPIQGVPPPKRCATFTPRPTPNGAYSWPPPRTPDPGPHSRDPRGKGRRWNAHRCGAVPLLENDDIFKANV